MSAVEATRPPARPRPSRPRQRSRALLGRFGTLAWIALYLLATYLVGHGSLYTQNLILVAAVFGILALSLDLIAGMTGLYSLGHAGLFAFGAYGTTLMNADWGMNVFVALPIVVVGVGLIGLVMGVLSLRVSGLYFAVTTFVFTLVVSTIAGQLDFTGGPQGLIGPLFPDFPGWLSFLGGSVPWCVMIATLVAILVVWCIRRSPLYPVLLAIRDAEPFAAAAGVRTSLVKVGVIGLSAAMAGLAGWAFCFLGVVSPSQFNWSVTVNILVMVLLGGINTTLGPLIGAAIVSIYPAYVNISPLWQECLIAAVFVAVVVLFPTGIVGMLRRLAVALAPLLSRSRLLTAALPFVADIAPPAPLVDPTGPLHREASSERRPEAEWHADGPDVPAVDCRGIGFHYVRGVRVLNDVDFQVRRGTIHGLIGPNGSGKSTLVGLIAGALRPQGGSIELYGAHVERSGPAARAREGAMRTFQSAVLVDELSSRDNVLIGLYTRVSRIALRAPIWPMLPRARRDLRWMSEQGGRTLDWVGAGEWADRPTGRVPHGIQQLTQLAAASAARPRLLILDEPFAGLTTGEVDSLMEILRELRTSGVTVILIEHQTRVVFSLCDEVTVLNAGQIVATGPAAEVFENERVREVYLGQ